MSNRENLADWHAQLFEISTKNLLRRDDARRVIEIERIVHERVERDEAVIEAAVKAKHWRAIYGAD